MNHLFFSTTKATDNPKWKIFIAKMHYLLYSCLEEATPLSIEKNQTNMVLVLKDNRVIVFCILSEKKHECNIIITADGLEKMKKVSPVSFLKGYTYTLFIIYHSEDYQAHQEKSTYRRQKSHAKHLQKHYSCVKR